MDLVRAIQHANRILSWYSNLPEDEMPPEWMWPYEDLVVEWFEEVDRKRKERYGSDDDDDDDNDSGSGSPMMSNDFAKGRGRMNG